MIFDRSVFTGIDLAHPDQVGIRTHDLTGDVERFTRLLGKEPYLDRVNWPKDDHILDPSKNRSGSHFIKFNWNGMELEFIEAKDIDKPGYSEFHLGYFVENYDEIFKQLQDAGVIVERYSTFEFPGIGLRKSSYWDTRETFGFPIELMMAPKQIEALKVE